MGAHQSPALAFLQGFDVGTARPLAVSMRLSCAPALTYLAVGVQRKPHTPWV